MSAAADLDTAQWQAFNALLDQLLDQPPAERSTWIDTLPAEHDALKPALRALAARAQGLETREFLATLPAMPEAARADAELTAGDRIGPYRLLRELGIGGMGAVWLAERVDGALKRQVALKLPRTSWTRGLAERMARERDILATLEHPNIARLYDAGTDARGRPYLALEYVEGQPVDAYCTQHQLTVRARVELLLQVARAVAFAHGRLVVHRDLKPSNILVTADGQVRLLDFGIAKLMEGDRAAETQLTQLAGRALTPDYASPEQIRGEPIGTASDVYSLGVVAFELLAGARPYRLKRGSAAEVEEAVLAADVPLASSVAVDAARKRALRGDLDAILAQALRKDVARRYASVDALADDLSRHQAGQPVTARPDSAAYRLRKFVARNGLVVGAGVSVAVALAVGAGVSVWQASKARAQANRAEVVQAFLLDLFRTNSGEQQSNAEAAQATTARELLDRGAERINQSLADAPDAQFDVLGVLASIYDEMGLSHRGLDLSVKRLALARQAFGRQDERSIAAAIDVIASLQESDRTQEIPPLLSEVDEYLKRTGDKRLEIRGRALMQAAHYWRYKSLARARKASRELAVYYETGYPSHSSTPSAHLLAARANLAGYYFEEAVLDAQAALQASDRLGQAGPWRASVPLAALASGLQGLGQLKDADAAYTRSIELSVQRRGLHHPNTLLAKAQYANLLLMSGRIREGERIQEEIRGRLATGDPTLTTEIRADLAGLLARHLTARGRPDLALPLLETQIENLKKTLPGSQSLGNAYLSASEALAALGRTDEAFAAHRLAESEWRTFLDGDPAPRAVTRLVISHAHLLRIAKRPNDALALLDPALAAAPADKASLLIERAACLHLLARHGDATATAREALRTLDALGEANRLPYLEAAAQLQLALGERALGHEAAAADAFERALALRTRLDLPNSVWLRELRSLLTKSAAVTSG